MFFLVCEKYFTMKWVTVWSDCLWFYHAIIKMSTNRKSLKNPLAFQLVQPSALLGNLLLTSAEIVFLLVRLLAACSSWSPLTYVKPLTTTRATIVAQVFFVITRQPLKLDRCSNPLRMRKVFLVLLQKFFLIGVRGSPGVGSRFRFFDQFWRALDANPMDQNFGANCFWKLHALPRR